MIKKIVSVLPVLVVLISSCSRQENNSVRLTWDSDKAVAAAIPFSITGPIPADSVSHLLSVQLASSGSGQSILGTWIVGDDEKLIFKPIVAFTRGLTYEVYLRAQIVAAFEVPINEQALLPEVTNIYPSADTVPENLLKVYVRFTKPMSSGRSSTFIHVLKNGKDTLAGTFLDLQPELWNEDNTLLTLWLDPGRVKRDLIPNRELGSPLEKGNSYVVQISPGWKSQDGAVLKQTYSKAFFTTQYDDRQPDAEVWKISSPRAGSKDPVRVDFPESLDYALLMDALHLSHEKLGALPVEIKTGNAERHVIMRLKEPWTPGVYTLEIESRLEDLAGNNLNRAFDTNLNTTRNSGEQKFYVRNFTILP